LVCDIPLLFRLFGLGALLTFAVGIVDGLDGKLARIRGCPTKLGLMEHPFDILYEFSWLIALALFLSQSEGLLPIILTAFPSRSSLSIGFAMTSSVGRQVLV